MRRLVAFLAAALCSDLLAARAPPLRDPVLLNIGLVCRWEGQCMKIQRRAMGQALRYVQRRDPPVWKIEQCNRNASRRRTWVDWMGFNNCIRNPSLPRQRAAPRRR